VLEQDFKALEAERAKAEARPVRKPARRDPKLHPPMVSLAPPAAVEIGRDLRIAAKAAAPDEVH